MKKILLFICLLVSVQMFSQNIPGYNTRTVREKVIAFAIDSGLHIPRYCGAPSGVRTGVYVADGALAMDTCNNRLYIYSGGAWIRLASFPEIATGSRFGVEDVMAGQNRNFTGLNNTYGIYLDSLNEFRVDRNGVTRIYMSNTSTQNQSPDGNTLLNIQNGLTQLSISSASNYLWGRADSFLLHKKASYEGNIHSTFFPYSLVDKSYVDSVAGGATPTLQQVVDVGNDVANNSIDIDGFNGGYIRFIQSGDPINMEGGDNTLKINRESDAGGTQFDFSLQTALRTLKLPDVSDTLADRSWVRSLGVGGSGTVTDFIFTDGNGFDGTVTNSTTTPTLALNLQQGFKDWYQYYLDVSLTTYVNFYTSSSGSGSLATRPAASIADGWLSGLQYSTGTTSSGFAYTMFGTAATFAPIAINSSYRYNYGCNIRLEDLSDGTDTYEFFTGFGESGSSSGLIVDGVYFRYIHSDSSGQFICVTENNGTKTESASGVTVAADTDYTLEISVIGGSAYFYINNSLVKTIATNVPSGTARATSTTFAIVKTAGTNSRTVYAEWVALGKRNN